MKRVNWTPKRVRKMSNPTDQVRIQEQVGQKKHGCRQKHVMSLHSFVFYFDFGKNKVVRGKSRRALLSPQTIFLCGIN